MTRRLAWWFWTKFDRDWGWNLARLLAFTLLMALFAIVGLQLVALALTLRLTATDTAQSVVAYALRFLPDRVEASAVMAFARSLRTAPVGVLALGLPVAVWYGSRFFVVLESALCVIFRRPKRRFMAQNRAALLMLLLMVALLPVIVFSATAIPHLDFSRASLSVSVIDTEAFGAWPWWPWLALLAGLAANFVLLLVAYTGLTPGFVSLRAAWPGALVAAALSQGYLLIFPLYVRYVLYPSHFGSIAGFALVALVFFYAYGLFIIIGAEIAAIRAGYAPSAHDLTGVLARSVSPAPPRSLIAVAPRPQERRVIPAAVADEASAATVAGNISAVASEIPTDPWMTAERR